MPSKKKPFWDIEENKGFTRVGPFNMDNKHVFYKVRNDFTTGSMEAAYRIYQSDKFLKSIKKFLQINSWHPDINDEVLIFLKTPHKIQEIPSNATFKGINKPKNVKKHQGAAWVGPDKEQRASWRLIMLSIRKRNGSLKEWKDTQDLLIHEIAHTLANHVNYRHDDHKSDFKKSEKYLKGIANHPSFIKIFNEN